MRTGIPDFKRIAARQQKELAPGDVDRLLDRGRAFGDLAPVLRAGGALLFPHVGIAAGGHQTAAAVQAALDSGAETVLVLGVLHALSDAMQDARVRVAEGGDPAREPFWGIQGPDSGEGREEWKGEFSLDHFRFLWSEELARRPRSRIPRVVERFPYLAGGKPDRLPGIAALGSLLEPRGGRRRTVVLATGDLFHHGIAYGDVSDAAREPGDGGLTLAEASMVRGFAYLRAGDHAGYQAHSVDARSDARDVGQVLGHLLGPLDGRILDLVAEDMTGPYGKPAPSWVAGALVALTPC